MHVYLNPNSLEDYRLFLRIKALPRYRIVGRMATVPDEYASLLGLSTEKPSPVRRYEPLPGLFDYQAAVSRQAIRKKKYAAFVRCGYGKTLILLEYVRHVAACLPAEQCVLITSPLMVIKQTLAEATRFYGDSLPIEQIAARDLKGWLRSGSRIGITNYEAITQDLEPGRLGCLACDESGNLRSHYGKWGTKIIDLGKGLAWKLCLTGTPAPNDRIEFANHAVFLDAFPTINSFLARFFVNRGQTHERWELKPHALRPFYRALSDWCIFLENPATYGWQDNTAPLPPVDVTVHDVTLTEEQQTLAWQKTGTLFADQIGGITNRSVLSQIAKGTHKGKPVATGKPACIRQMVDSWSGDESTIIWCLYNAEQKLMEQTFPEAASLQGDTPYAERDRMIDDFKAGRQRVLISKPRCLGFGLNLQVCTRMVFSGIQDSYEVWWQCIARANRVGSTRPLNVHVPLTDIERPMFESVLRKARRIQQDALEQERLFKEAGYGML